MLKLAMAAFVRMIETGQPPISLEETPHVIAVLNAAQRSVESGGRRVPVPGVRGKSFRWRSPRHPLGFTT